jgi:hypothetical protein
MTVETSFTARIAGLRAAAARARSGTLSPAATTDALVAASVLIDELNLQAFLMSGTSCLEQVTATVHGFGLHIRGRTGEVLVRVEDRRADRDRRTKTLTVDVTAAEGTDSTEP